MAFKASRPIIRAMFKPDPDWIIFDADLSGADAQVVAWEAEEEPLKEAFRSGVSVHALNAEMMFGTRFTSAEGAMKNKHTAKGKLYDDCKRAIHGTNYGAHPNTIAATLGWTRHEADLFRSRWFSLRPGIPRWHARIERELRTTATTTNRFGYRIRWFDRLDSLLPEALAWTPQSTVALATFYGAQRVCAHYTPRMDLPKHPDNLVRWFLQVHDSLVFEVHKDVAPRILPHIKELLPIQIPYADPLTIPWKIAASDQNWHECSESHPILQQRNAA